MTIATAAAHRLLEGVDAALVLSELRAACSTVASLSTTLACVRAHVLDGRCAAYDAAPLRALREPEADAFLTLSTREQYAVQKAHAATQTWSEEAERLLAALRIVPRGFESLKLTREELLAHKRAAEAAQVRKNERVLVIADAAPLLRLVERLLESASPRDSYARLVLPLLLVSGRRSSEITNGRSSFTPLPHAHGCMFAGQLKKKKAAPATPYPIPLLVPFATFARGLNVLRDKQGTDVAMMSNSAVCDRYASNLKRDMLDVLVEGGMPPCHPHDLRSAYAALVFELFECEHTFARTAMRILGHESLRESLSYNNVRIRRVPQGALGPLADCIG